MSRLDSVEAILVHCSDSNWGTVEDIDRWHTDKGWAGCGYHFVVSNGWPTAQSARGPRDPEWEGRIQRGRALELAGAHCPEWNRRSVAVCMIGGKFSDLQVARTAALVAALQEEFPLATKVLGHRETTSGQAQGKTCPDFPMDVFRRMVLAARLLPSVSADLLILAEAAS